MDCEKERKSVSSQEREMQISGKNGERSTWSGRMWHLGGSGSCEGASYKKEKENKSTRRQMTWHKQCWTKDIWQKPKQKLCSRKEKGCMQHCSERSASTAW